MVTSLIVYWSRWPLTGEVLLVVFAGLIIYFYFQFKNEHIATHLKSGFWFVCYLLAMASLSWLGDHEFGGVGLLKGPFDQISVAIVALIFYYWSVKSAWITPMMQAFRQNKDMT